MPNKIETLKQIIERLENAIQQKTSELDKSQQHLTKLVWSSKQLKQRQTYEKSYLDQLLTKPIEECEKQEAVERSKTKTDSMQKKLDQLSKEQVQEKQKINQIDPQIKQLEQTLKPLIETQKKLDQALAYGYLGSINTLQGYQEALTKQSPKKGGIFQSNQVAKGQIAEEIVIKMQEADPSNLQEMTKLKTLIENNIKVNKKQTGFRLWNRGGDLNKHLNATLKMVDTTIEVLNKLGEPKKTGPKT